MKKQLIRSYAIMALGSVIFALAFDAFFSASQVAMGGITGLAQVINVLLPGLSVGLLAFLLNVPLFLAGWKFIGFHLLASSLFSMAVSSAAIDAIAAAYTFPAMDPMLAAICGALTYVLLYMLKTYVYNQFVYGYPMDVVLETMLSKFIPSIINAGVAIVAAPLFYHAVLPALRTSGLLKRMRSDA